MLGTQTLDVQTASRERSIWRGIGENQFRSHVVQLAKKFTEVPDRPRVHSLQEWEQLHSAQSSIGRTLPFAVEQYLADNIAFIAAAEEGAKYVSAVGIEELRNHAGLVVRLAVNNTTPQYVAEALEQVFNSLQNCASRRAFHLVLQK